jgi:uncharacterized membrane protein YphA (DoxX/SURF4 family)
VPDVNSLEMLNPRLLKASWDAEVGRIAGQYGFDRTQRDKAAALLKQAHDFADVWFTDHEIREKLEKYKTELRGVQMVERDFHALSYDRERAAAKRRDLDTERKDLIADLQARETSLRTALIDLATKEQLANGGKYVPAWTSLDTINALTMYGLIAMGFCLMAGFFTPLAALAGAAFLGQIYLSMPPWPGLPASPMAEGHYMIVNKNLIEMIACLALVFIPTGHWIGFDALLFGGRRRQNEPVATPARPDARPPSSNTGTGAGTSRGAKIDVKPIPLSSPGSFERE